MNRYLLDINALSETARPRPSTQLVARFQAHRAELCTSSVPSLPILPYDRESAHWQAEERARLERVGRIVPFRDAQIAAVARVNDLVLVTANLAELAGFEGLRVESWMESAAV